jgi:hypothetical protein
MTQQEVNNLASAGKTEAEILAAGGSAAQITKAVNDGYLTRVPANAGLTIGQIYNINVTGFTFIQDYSVIKGKITENDEAVSVIIGDKMSFGISEMFKLKEASGIEAKYIKDSVVKGVTYKRFLLEQICW